MRKDVNRMYFSKHSIENGDFSKFLKVLMDYCYSDNDSDGFKHYNDIHIKPEDLGAFTIEWVQVPWSREYGGRFEYLEEDEEILKLYRFPDGHGEYLIDEDEFNYRLGEWLEENPGWRKHNIMNIWVNDGVGEDD